MNALTYTNTRQYFVDVMRLVNEDRPIRYGSELPGNPVFSGDISQRIPDLTLKIR